MVKILKQGDLNRLKKYKKFECDQCGCEFIADNTEYRNVSTQRDGPAFVIVCPCCNKNAYNNSSEYISSDIVDKMERCFA